MQTRVKLELAGHNGQSDIPSSFDDAPIPSSFNEAPFELGVVSGIIAGKAYLSFMSSLTQQELFSRAEKLFADVAECKLVLQREKGLGDAVEERMVIEVHYRQGQKAPGLGL